MLRSIVGQPVQQSSSVKQVLPKADLRSSLPTGVLSLPKSNDINAINPQYIEEIKLITSCKSMLSGYQEAYKTLSNTHDLNKCNYKQFYDFVMLYCDRKVRNHANTNYSESMPSEEQVQNLIEQYIFNINPKDQDLPRDLSSFIMGQSEDLDDYFNDLFKKITDFNMIPSSADNLNNTLGFFDKNPNVFDALLLAVKILDLVERMSKISDPHGKSFIMKISASYSDLSETCVLPKFVLACKTILQDKENKRWKDLTSKVINILYYIANKKNLAWVDPAPTGARLRLHDLRINFEKIQDNFQLKPSLVQENSIQDLQNKITCLTEYNQDAKTILLKWHSKSKEFLENQETSFNFLEIMSKLDRFRERAGLGGKFFTPWFTGIPAPDSKKWEKIRSTYPMKEIKQIKEIEAQMDSGIPKLIEDNNKAIASIEAKIKAKEIVAEENYMQELMNMYDAQNDDLIPKYYKEEEEHPAEEGIKLYEDQDDIAEIDNLGKEVVKVPISPSNSNSSYTSYSSYGSLSGGRSYNRYGFREYNYSSNSSYNSSYSSRSSSNDIPPEQVLSQDDQNENYYADGGVQENRDDSLNKNFQHLYTMNILSALAKSTNTSSLDDKREDNKSKAYKKPKVYKH